MQNLVTFQDLINNPKLLEDPNLVVRYDGQYYNMKAASPLIISLMVFRRPLPQVSAVTILFSSSNYLTFMSALSAQAMTVAGCFKIVD